ncbi:MAG: hypothetical protein GY823_14210, partial [Flavobacteriaceae bacterium]|nr:hypothetical protein [Flavobacteriaceae bacterium]
MKVKAIFAYLVVLIFTLPTVLGQYSSTMIKTKHQVYTDSLKQVEYNYIFPIFGQGAYEKGFDIPYPVG